MHLVLAQLVLSTVAVGLLVPSSVAAQAPVHAIEAFFGASNVQATTGNGRLTVGVSHEGALSVVSWPSPTFHDHVAYIAQNGVDARSLPRMGAEEGMGVFAGLAYTDGAGAMNASFVIDEGWSRDVRFEADDNSIVVTRYSQAEIGVEIEQVDWVDESRDVLVRRYHVAVDGAADVEEAWLLSYANLSPKLGIVPEIPIGDFALEHRNDFAAYWNDSSDSVVHFRPASDADIDRLIELVNPPPVSLGAVEELMVEDEPSATAVAAFADTVDSEYGEGVYAAFTTIPPPDQHQIGLDATDICGALDRLVGTLAEISDEYPDVALPVDAETLGTLGCSAGDRVLERAEAAGWIWRPEDALVDARDGTLSGSDVAAAQVNAALRTPLTFSSGGEAREASATFVLSFGTTVTDALDGLSAMREEGAINRSIRQARAAHEAYVTDLFLPEEFSAALRRFSLRAFLNLRVGTDAATGAIVAAITRQAPYHLDWPRDGAFFNAALDIAGHTDLVTMRQRFYASVMRDAAVPPTPLLDEPVPGWPGCPTCVEFPPDSYEMNYYANGEIGGNTRLEIDNTALLIWSFVDHVGYLESEAERDAYLAEIWPAIERGATFLAGWRDPETGLTWPANEDDNPEYTQGLQAATTVFAALRAAASAARALGEDAKADEWAHRAGELKSATLTYLFDEEIGFVWRPGLDQPVLGGPLAWLVWPAGMLSADDPRVADQLREALAAQLARVRGEGRGGSYTTKVGISAAFGLEDGDARDSALEMAELLAGEIADPDTHYLGEVFRNLDTDGDGAVDARQNAVSTPHLWAGVLVYLNAVAYYAPERFDRYRRVLPDVEIPEVPVPGEDEPTGDVGVAPDAGGAGDAGVDDGASLSDVNDAGGRASDADEGEAGEPSTGDDGDRGCGCGTAGRPALSGRLLLPLLLALMLLAARRSERSRSTFV